MECMFVVYGPGENGANKIYEFKVPCVNQDGWDLN